MTTEEKKIYNQGFKRGFMQGVFKGKDKQLRNDIDKCCMVYANLLSTQGYKPLEVNDEIIKLTKALEE